MLDSNVSNAEIKSLLILLLLKSGTRPEEIQTAMQLASVSRFMDEARVDEPPQQQAPLPPQVAAITPKQIVRNTYLAPIPQPYAA